MCYRWNGLIKGNDFVVFETKVIKRVTSSELESRLRWLLASTVCQEDTIQQGFLC